MRVTDKQLDLLAERLNKMTRNPVKPYTRRPEGGCKANVGCYTVSGAYGGVELQQIVNEGGGVNTISRDGHDTRRKLRDFMVAYMDGLTVKKV